LNGLGRVICLLLAANFFVNGLFVIRSQLLQSFLQIAHLKMAGKNRWLKIMAGKKVGGFSGGKE
jgi:hypothetical protein